MGPLTDPRFGGHQPGCPTSVGGCRPGSASSWSLFCLDQGMSRREAAAYRRVSVSTVQYWIGRYRAAEQDDRRTGAWAEDRPSTPHRQPMRVSEAVHDRVCEARERTGWGPRLIAGELGMAHATVSRCLARRGVSRRPPRAREAVRRFEWPCPGDLLQMDTKRFARFTRPGHAVTGDRHRTAREAHARRLGVLPLDHRRPLARWPTANCTATSAPTPSPPSSSARWPSSPATASPRRAADRQRVDLHPQPRPARAARRRATSSIAGSRRGPRSATARSSATSRRWRANGPTGSATAQATPAPPRCPSGSPTTTPPGPTARSATGRPSAAPPFGTTRGRTSRRRTARRRGRCRSSSGPGIVAA